MEGWTLADGIELQDVSQPATSDLGTSTSGDVNSMQANLRSWSPAPPVRADAAERPDLASWEQHEDDDDFSSVFGSGGSYFEGTSDSSNLFDTDVSGTAERDPAEDDHDQPDHASTEGAAEASGEVAVLLSAHRGKRRKSETGQAASLPKPSKPDELTVSSDSVGLPTPRHNLSQHTQGPLPFDLAEMLLTTGAFPASGPRPDHLDLIGEEASKHSCLHCTRARDIATLSSTCCLN